MQIETSTVGVSFERKRSGKDLHHAIKGMPMTDFFAITWGEAAAIAAASVLAVGGVILYVRIAGLRAFAQ